MNSSIKPKPIQIRLPQDLEDSLRYAAYKSGNTLNSVVIECLKEHLPSVNQVDLAVYDGPGLCDQSEAQISKEVGVRLGRYQKAVQLHLELVLQLASLLNTQAIYSKSMQDSLLDGVKPKVPENSDGTIPDLRTEQGLSHEFLHYLDASNLLKSETAIRKCRKEMARYQYDAAGEWGRITELLRKLDPKNQVAATDPSV